MCFIVVLGLMLPRLSLAGLYVFTEPRWTNVLEPWWLALLGLLFLPYTTLAYVLIHHYSDVVTTQNMTHLIVMIFALLVDLGAWRGGHRHYRGRG